jgi:hypothetical protein
MKVFVSHIHEEAKLALVLKDWIESTFAGQIQVFASSDIKDIPAGSQWLSEIDSALTSSALFVMLCSPTSISRSWINFEAGCAWMKKVPLMPICHSGLSKNNLPSPLSIFQALEIGSNEFVDSFLESLRVQFKIPKLPRIDKKTMYQEVLQALDSIKATPPKSLHTVQTSPAQVTDNDALNIIESWMGHRDASLNTQTIRFSEVDSELNLPPGTAKRLIEIAARRWDYTARRKGEDTILFEEMPLRTRSSFDDLGF